MNLQLLSPAWTWPVLLLLAIAAVVYARWVYGRTVPAPEPTVRRWLVVLRSGALVLVLAALARPLLVAERSRPEPAVVAVVLEDSGSMALQDRGDRPTRWRQAVLAATAIDSLLQARGDGAELVLLRGNGLGELRETSLAEARQDTPRAVGSDLAQLVDRARQRLLNRSLRGVVVLGDGHSHRGRPLARPGQVPLWLAGVGDVQGQPDRSLADLRYPDAVHVGEDLLVEFAVRQRLVGQDADSLEVTLRHEGEVVQRRRLAAGDLVRGELTWTPQQEGLAVLEVEVNALDNERFQSNNRATLAVDVAKDRARVLLLGLAAGWDGRFLAQAALAEPRLALSVLRPGPAGPVLADSLTSWVDPGTAARWRERYDAVVLAGPPGDVLADGGAQLADAVGQGLGLLVLAADARGELAPRPWQGPLLEVLPVTAPRGRLRRGEQRLSLAADGRGHAAVKDLELGELPPLRAIMPATPRPAARTLLESGDQPVLVAGEPGQGRVLWFGARRLWELAFWQPPRAALGGDHPGRGLLRQLLLWAALGDEAGGVSLLGQPLALEEGEPLPVSVSWRDLRGDPVTSAPVTVAVAPADSSGDPRRYNLRPDPGRPGVYSGVLPPLAPGRWQLTPRGEGDPPEVGDPHTVVVTAAESERAQVRQDRRNLRQVAARLGATVATADSPMGRDELLQELVRLDLTPRATTRLARLEPTATWGWLVVVLALLAAEWLLRRRQGLL